MSEKLLPCPFCGGEARTFEYDGANQATCGGKHIDCAGTDVVAPVAMWNRRTPAPEGEACPHDAWSVDSAGQQTHCVDCGCAHPAPIKPSGDTGELRERVARKMFDADSKENGLARDWMFEGGCHASYFAMADAAISLIQSERAG